MAKDDYPDTPRPAVDSLSEAVRAVVIVPVLTRHARREEGEDAGSSRTPEARLEEAVGLADAIDLDVVHAELVTISAPRPATLMGTGKVEEIAEKIAEFEAQLVIIDHPLTPVQQRNLERSFNAKVIDRTGIILEIFGARARTKEGRLQVDLAQLEYQRGRLVRSWTHLERQRGGGGFMGGPGETQIEADRRQLQERIVRLKRELETVRRTRDLHRSKRRKVPFPIVSIVGYTNAGKSTLFNRLTGAAVIAEDMLFATLDPTLRRLKLPHGTTVILSDTVGFISDLPTHLIAAFRATLEEVVEAELVIHLRDISDPDTAAQADDVRKILLDLGIDAASGDRVIEVWNKVDLLADHDRMRLSAGQHGADPAALSVSAITGEGLDALMRRIEERVAGSLSTFTMTLDPDHLHLVDWLYRHGEVTQRIDNEDGSVSLELRAPQSAREAIEGRLSSGDKG